MTPTEEPRECTWVQGRLEAHLDGDLPAGEGAELDKHLRQCAVCTHALAQALQVQEALRALPLQVCPDRVTEAAWSRVRQDLRVTRRHRLQAWLSDWCLHPWRPALVAMAALVLTVATTLVIRHQESRAEVSPAELARAELQVRWTLGYLAQLSRRTGLTVRDQVIRARVVEPLQKTMAAKTL